MTWYRTITILGPPTDVGVDDQQRTIYSFIIEVEKAKSATFERELVKILVDAGVGTFATNIFAGSQVRLPIEPEATFLVIITSGGRMGERVQNTPGTKIVRPRAAIRVHSGSTEAALQMSNLAFNALDVVVNQDVTAA